MANVIGLITVNGKEILEVDADPSAGGGTASPLGSLAMYDTGVVGQLYLKTAAADTGWSLMDSNANDWSLSGNALVGTEFLGSTNDQDVIFKRNNLEAARFAGSTAAALSLLVGLNASVGGRLQLLASAYGNDISKEMTTATSGDNIIKVTRQSKVLTTNATVTPLFSIAVPTDSVVHINSRVVGRQTGGTSGTAGTGAVYVRDIHAKNDAGTATLFKVQTSFTSEDRSQWGNTYAASGANIVSSVQGEANRNISWFSHIDMLIATN